MVSRAQSRYRLLKIDIPRVLARAGWMLRPDKDRGKERDRERKGENGIPFCIAQYIPILDAAKEKSRNDTMTFFFCFSFSIRSRLVRNVI